MSEDKKKEPVQYRAKQHMSQLTGTEYEEVQEGQIVDKGHPFLKVHPDMFEGLE